METTLNLQKTTKLLLNFWASVLFVVFPAILYSQTCTIIGPANVCLGDLASFSVTTSPSPVSYTWDFGDGSSSVQPTPGYTYGAHASRTVTVVVTYAGGTTCTDTKNITIHPKPVSAFSVNTASTSFCLSKNQVCINDNSTPGTTGNPIVQRVFLWDDGAGDNTSNPAATKTFCHKYIQIGSYNLVMETTDDKGCQSKSTLKVQVFPDYAPSFTRQLTGTQTDCKFIICFDNTTKPADTAFLASYEWDFGDGAKTSAQGSYKSVCHEYVNTGTYTAKLKVKHTLGCVDSALATINVVKPTFDLNLQMPKTVCFGKNATLQNIGNNPGAQYRWFYRDSASGREVAWFEQTNPITFSPPFPGKFYIKLNMLKDSCSKNAFDSIEFTCPVAKFSLNNNNQCAPGDTTYFCDESCYERVTRLYRLWDFKHGEACTTDTKNGINATRNCQFSVDANAKHLYDYPTPTATSACYSPTLFLKDSATGCESTGSGSVRLGMPDISGLIFTDTAKKYCIDLTNTKPDRVVGFTIDGLSCNNSWNLFLNVDSAAGINNFAKVSANPPPSNLYRSTANPNGDVTTGLIISNGGMMRYSSCTDTLGKSPYCADTVWKHKMFNIAPVPNPYTSYFPEKNCAPYNFTLQIDDTIQYGVSKIKWDWGDGTADSLYLGPNDSIIPVRYHTYWKAGLYTPFISLENSRGCEEIQYIGLGLGYDNFVDYDSIICAGDSVEFKEYLSYFDQSYPFWMDSARNAQGKEQVRWDFGDGKGFVYKKPETKVVFANEGKYTVRMASKDSTGCVDTITFVIQAVKADAHIRDMADTFYCNDNIVRFYDSSFGSPQIPGDVVTDWLWNFGDGKNNSYLKDPFHYYSSFGLQKVALVVKSKAGCTDTAFKDIMIVGPEPRFEIITDSIGCDPHKVVFKNTSNRVRSMIWKMGDISKTIINTDSDTNITFTYTPPGTYYITLYGADSIYNPTTGNTYFCESTYPDTPLVKRVIVIPNYPVGLDIPDTVCENNPFLVTSVSATRYDYFRWWMGNGDSIFTKNTQAPYSYQLAGNYRIDFKPDYTPSDTERRCVADTFKNITVIPIKADFDISPNSKGPVYYFTNTSANASRYEWDFGHQKSGSDNFSNDVHPMHSYGLEKGTFLVCLRAYNSRNCVDTVCKPISNDYVPRLFIPNVFTPDGDDTINKRFDIDIFFAKNYHLIIYNRWGEKVFEGFEDGEGNLDPINWNGRKFNTGDFCPPGVYNVVFDYEIWGLDEPKTYTGTITLFRE